MAYFLVVQGLPAGVVTAAGNGDTQPVAPIDTAQGRAKNRHVVTAIPETK